MLLAHNNTIDDQISTYSVIFLSTGFIIWSLVLLLWIFYFINSLLLLKRKRNLLIKYEYEDVNFEADLNNLTVNYWRNLLLLFISLTELLTILLTLLDFNYLILIYKLHYSSFPGYNFLLDVKFIYFSTIADSIIVLFNFVLIKLVNLLIAYLTTVYRSQKSDTGLVKTRFQYLLVFTVIAILLVVLIIGIFPVLVLCNILNCIEFIVYWRTSNKLLKALKWRRDDLRLVLDVKLAYQYEESKQQFTRYRFMSAFLTIFLLFYTLISILLLLFKVSEFFQYIFQFNFEIFSNQYVTIPEIIYIVILALIVIYNLTFIPIWICFSIDVLVKSETFIQLANKLPCVWKSTNNSSLTAPLLES